MRDRLYSAGRKARVAIVKAFDHPFVYRGRPV